MLNSAAADAAPTEAQLARFVSARRSRTLEGRQVEGPASRTVTAVVLYVDIVGFTAFSGKMTDNYAAGAEQVAADVKGVLTGIAGIAARHGGEVMHFAGDAAWIGWFVEAAGDLPAACHRAAVAALAVSDAARSWTIGRRSAELRAALGAGQLEQLELGGDQGEWCGLVRGAAIADAVRADSVGSAGAVAISPTVRQHLRDIGRVSELPGGCARLEEVLPLRPPTPATLDLGGTLAAGLAEIMAIHPGTGDGTQWSGEFRTCHIVFGRLHGRDGDPGVEQLQLAVREIQQVLHRSMGSLYQLLSDEKGLAVIAAYGLPPHARGSDGTRALEAGALLNQELRGYGLDAHFGIAVGRVFCTTYGTSDRLQFALVGPALNRAARLADTSEGVIVEAEIVENGVPPTLIVLPLPPRALRGIDGTVAVSAIRRRIGEVTTSPESEVLADLVGRDAELAVGTARLAALADGREGGLLLIEGDPGAGKSALAASLLAVAASRSLATARGSADEVERAAEYRPWRQALRTILAGAVEPGGRLSERALAALGDNRGYAGLLSRVLDVPPDPGGRTAHLPDEARAALVRQMTVDLLRAKSRQRPIVLLLEDLHWFDSPSLALLGALLDADLAVLVIATTRSTGQFADLLAGAMRQRLLLAGLDARGSAELLAKVCGAASVDDALSEEVRRISSGNPLFTAQLARFLLDHGLLEVRSGALVAASKRLALDQAFEAYGVPATLEGVVMARLDVLPAAAREAARVASVLGASFLRADLSALVGRPPDLSPLVAADILSQHGDIAEFCHAILRDVAYSTISLADRRRLHAAAAHLLATSRADEADGQLDAVLAHHLEHAGDFESAAARLLRAGTSSLRNNANREALSHQTRGLELLKRIAPDRRHA